jgi:ribosomal protein S18 acetylase RimI-like enzyme
VAFFSKINSKDLQQKNVVFQGIVLKHLFKYGRVHVCVNKETKQVHGAAIWHPPSLQKLNLLDVIRSGLLKMPLVMGLRNGLRFFATIEMAVSVRERYMKKRPHWFLINIAVSKSHRRQGIAKALMQPILGTSIDIPERLIDV